MNADDPSEPKIVKYSIEKAASASKWTTERDMLSDHKKHIWKENN